MAVTAIADTGLIARLDRPLGTATVTAIGSAAVEPVVVGTMTTDAGELVVSGNTAPTVFHSGGIGAAVATMGTDATAVNTETYIVEFFISNNCTITGVSFLLNASSTGNIQASLATSAGVPIAAAKTASTAATAAAAYQQIPFATAYAAVGPAKYFLLMQNSGANHYQAHVIGNFGAAKKTGETYGTFTTVTAPTTFTTNLAPICDLY